ncbi:MAG TPA: DUF3667 domain-containing protein [Candidatus Kapabacteria bacterium]|jgi:hypothetical protein
MENTTESLRTCPDCGASGAGNFCANCGEELEPYLPKVRQFFRELLSEIVSFDSKVVRTIPALLFRPGFLTKEYIEGRRRKYLLPWRLYFLVALFSFFLFGAVFHDQAELRTSGESQTLELGNTRSSRPGTTFHFGYTPNADSSPIHSPDPNASQNGQIVFAYLIDTFPYVILIGSAPLFALILKLLYKKKKLLYVTHLIFSFHFFAFALFLFIIGFCFDPSTIHIAVILLFLAYLFFALWKAYNDRGIVLVLRFIVSSVSYFVVMAIGVIVSTLVAYGLALYMGKIPKPPWFPL